MEHKRFKYSCMLISEIKALRDMSETLKNAFKTVKNYCYLSLIHD